MSEAASNQVDHTPIFTPPKPSHKHPSDPPGSRLPIQAENQRPFFVAAPGLPSAEKRQYKELPQSFKNVGVEFDDDVIERISGEYVIDGTLFYFVRFKDGISHRVTDRFFPCKTRLSDAFCSVSCAIFQTEVW
jgi:hypothetical protein